MEILNDPQFNQKVRQHGETIFQGLESEPSSLFNKDWWYSKIMDWSMRDEKFKTQMFRFVDVLPYLNSSQEVARHMKEYFAESDSKLSSLMSFGSGLGALAPGLMASTVRKNITQMAKMFITGESPKEALIELKKSRDKNLAFTADLLGEATLSEKEALEYQSRYLELIDWLHRDSQSWSHNSLVDEDHQGPIPRVNVSVKLTALYSQISEKAWDQSVENLKDRLRPILKLARERHVFINIDMEQYKFKEMTYEVFKSLLMEPDFINYPHFGIVVQAYLKEALKDVQNLVSFAQVRKTPITIRLVKGAYWDYETIHADQNNWPSPVFGVKAESDVQFEKCAYEILKNHQHTRLAAGSHNVRSIAAVIALAEHFKIDKKAIEVQMLYGMAEPIKASLIKQNIRVREYATIGELIPGMAYLVRRLLENTSNESFLRSKFAENVSTDKLLSNPAEHLKNPPAQKAPIPERFYNEPLLDYTIKDNRLKTLAALNEFKKKMGETIPLIINGKKITTKEIYTRQNPSRSSEVVGKICMAQREHAEMAVQEASKAFKSWSNEPIEKRVQILKTWAQLMRRDRFQLIAIEIEETGKPWAEADGDVAEAIDFCDYYAREAEKLFKPTVVSHVLGEDSRMHYKPRGVSLVISPWNFPLAILCGMTAASLVTGNTVIVKPAEQSSIIAYEMMKLLFEAGCPFSVAHFVPGYGEDIGRFLVQHPKVHLISFTGSKNVGLEIVSSASRVLENQHFVKKCIIEMGGKNALIIDSDADLDEAVSGLLYSAFGFAGQKCSAASRAIVLEENYERFLSRLTEAAKSLVQTEASDPSAYYGPVVDQEAYDRIMATIELYKQKHTLAYQAELKKGGYFVPATIFADVDPQSDLAQQEIFGPVIAIIKAKNIDEAIAIANDCQYALTGGIYSRSPAVIEKVKVELECGNLYINRGITGALVGRHPFGGYKLSGLGSKTGGKDYLLNYVEPRVITENTVRRGFAPPIADGVHS